MSDSFLIIVPTNPRHAPNRDACQRVVAVAGQIAPSAEISSDFSEHIAFIDAGENFETVSCAHCATELDLQWWQQQMGDDFDGIGFKLNDIVLPCCGQSSTLNELSYDWPQAFGRFSCTMRNPEIELSPAQLQALESALGAPIVVVRKYL